MGRVGLEGQRCHHRGTGPSVQPRSATEHHVVPALRVRQWRLLASTYTGSRPLHGQPHNALPRAWHGTGGLSDAIVIRLAHAHHFTVSNCDWILRAYEQWQDVPDRCVEQELGRTHRLGLLGWSEISDNVTPAHSDLDLAVYQRIGLSDVHLTRTPLKRTTNER